MWFTPEALQYYVPAFLIAAVTLRDIPGSLDVIGYLAPPGRSEPSRSSFFYFAKGLNDEQKNVIRECLCVLGISMKGVYAFWS